MSFACGVAEHFWALILWHMWSSLCFGMYWNRFLQRRHFCIFLHIVSVAWSVCRLSSVTRAPCSNHLTDLDAIWQVHLWGPM